MTDLQSDRSKDQASSSAPSPAGNGPEPDPLATLHRMSRTAGSGTQEYIAINATSVAAVLLGVASALAILDPILLVVPAATVVVAIIAFRQVRRSAGTQKGTGLAVIALVLAGLFVAIVGGRSVLQARRARAEQGQVVALIDQLGKDLGQDNYDAAWELFSPSFQERVGKKEFVNVWTRLQATPRYGRIKAMRWNGILNLNIDPDSGQPSAQGVILVELESGQQDRREALFRKTDKGWVMQDIQGYFAPPMPTPRRPGAAGPPPPA